MKTGENKSLTAPKLQSLGLHAPAPEDPGRLCRIAEQPGQGAAATRNMTASNPHTRHDRTGQPPEQGHTTTNSSNNSNSFYNFKKSKLFSPPALPAARTLHVGFVSEV